MKDLHDKEQDLSSQYGPDTKLEIMQFAHREMHAVKEDMREMLRADIDDYKGKIQKRDKRIIKIASTVAFLLIGFNVWTWISITKTLNESITRALDEEVKRVRQTISDRLV